MAGIFDLLGGMGFSPYGSAFDSSGNFDPRAYQQSMNTAGMMGMAQGLMNASGPSSTPISFGQSLAGGMQGAMSGQDQYQGGAVNSLFQRSMGDPNGTMSPAHIAAFRQMLTMPGMFGGMMNPLSGFWGRSPNAGLLSGSVTNG